MYQESDNRHSFNILNEEFITDNKFQLLKIIGNGTYSIICSSIYDGNDETNEINNDNDTDTNDPSPISHGSNRKDIDVLVTNNEKNNGNDGDNNNDNITNNENKSFVAIKKIKDINLMNNFLSLKRSIRELILLKEFRGHPNIVCLYDVDLVFYSNGQLNGLYFYEELMGCDLSQIIKSSQPLSNLHFQCFIYQILCALKFVHSGGILLRELKPTNILVNEDCQLKICDFGLSRGYSTNPQINNEYLTEYVSTRWYRAPEIMLTYQNYSPAIDIWSTGCILAELIDRKPIFQGVDYVSQLNRILQILGTPPLDIINRVGSQNVKNYIHHLGHIEKKSFEKLYPDVHEDVIDLLDKMLRFDPRERITVTDALKHQFLSIWHDPEEEVILNHKINLTFEKITDLQELKNFLVNEVIDFRNSVRTNATINRKDFINDNIDNDNNVDTFINQDRETSKITKESHFNSDIVNNFQNANHDSQDMSHTTFNENDINDNSESLGPPVNIYQDKQDHNHNLSDQPFPPSSSSSLEKDLEFGIDGRFNLN